MCGNAKQDVRYTIPLCLIVIVVLAIFPVMASCHRTPTGQDSPAIRFSELTHFAKPDNGHVHHKFEVSNVGNRVLRIERVLSSCGCAVASLQENSVDPGESVALAVDLKATPDRRESTIVVVSNDPLIPTQRLKIGAVWDFSGLLELKFLPTSRQVNFGTSKTVVDECYLKLTDWGRSLGVEEMEAVELITDSDSFVANPATFGGVGGGDRESLLFWQQNPMHYSESRVTAMMEFVDRRVFYRRINLEFTPDRDRLMYRLNLIAKVRWRDQELIAVMPFVVHAVR